MKDDFVLGWSRASWLKHGSSFRYSQSLLNEMISARLGFHPGLCDIALHSHFRHFEV